MVASKLWLNSLELRLGFILGLSILHEYVVWLLILLLFYCEKWYQCKLHVSVLII